MILFSRTNEYEKLLPAKLMLFIALVFVLVIALGLPTVQSDNAFYLTFGGIKDNINQKALLHTGMVTYQGSLEWILLHLAGSQLLFIVLYKFVVVGLNFLFFSMTVEKSNRLVGIDFLKIILIFSAIYFYLLPGYYSLCLAGFSCAYLAARTKSAYSAMGYWVLAIYFCGFDLPNPKYIGLAYVVYLFSFFLQFPPYKEKVNWLCLYLNTALLFLVICVLAMVFLNAKIDVPLGYFTTNQGGLLDLVGRSYFAALLPFKANRNAFYIYALTFVYLQFFVFKMLSSEKKQKDRVYILFLIGTVYYFSLGIIEPTGIVKFIIDKYPILSFYRTRAGFDMVYFFCLYAVYASFMRNEVEKKTINDRVFISLSFLLMIPIVYQTAPSYLKNFYQLSAQAKVLDFFNRVNQITTHGCYLSDSPSYTANTMFDVGAPIARLATNFSYIHPDTFRKMQKMQQLSKDDEYNLITKLVGSSSHISFDLYQRYYQRIESEHKIRCDLLVLDEQYMRATELMGSTNFTILDRSFNYAAIDTEFFGALKDG